jgi:hypothetical protein
MAKIPSSHFILCIPLLFLWVLGEKSRFRPVVRLNYSENTETKTRKIFPTQDFEHGIKNRRLGKKNLEKKNNDNLQAETKRPRRTNLCGTKVKRKTKGGRREMGKKGSVQERSRKGKRQRKK